MSLTTFESALLCHFVGDWLLQNSWMADHKIDLRHPASWVHGTIHGALLALVFGWLGGLVLGVAHMLVDTRHTLRWWIHDVKKCGRSPELPLIALGCDQVLHLGCIAAWMALAGPTSR